MKQSTNELNLKLDISHLVWLLYNGEFDPGSERTLAARFKHASRRVKF